MSMPPEQRERYEKTRTHVLDALRENIESIPEGQFSLVGMHSAFVQVLAILALRRRGVTPYETTVDQLGAEIITFVDAWIDRRIMERN